LNLNDPYSDGEEEESHPLRLGEFTTEHEDGEAGGGEDLHLVGDLEGGDVEVFGGDVLEVVLMRGRDGGERGKLGEMSMGRSRDI